MKSKPQDAWRLLIEPERILFACSPYENDAWKKASMGTMGRDEQSVIEAFAKHSPEVWTDRVTALITGPLKVFEDAVEPLRVVEIPREEPWEREIVVAAGRELKTRKIVIPSILRRCLSNLFADVLAETSEPLLSRHAVAYRRGRTDAVRKPILDAARAIAKGNRYYAKLDISNCFPTIPWRQLERTLLTTGYPKPFVERLMALVKAPLEIQIRGRWIRQSNHRGAQAGVPESAILLNLLLNTMDRAVSTHEVFYCRYADDMLVVGSTKKSVVKALKALRAGVDSLGMQLKAVSSDQATESLVKDITREPLEFLGAEIQSDGDVRMPKAKLDAHLAKMTWLKARTAASTVIAVSKYQGGSPVDAYDLDDLRACSKQFHDYWRPLNEGDAMVASGWETRLGLRLESGSSLRRTWTAALGELGPLVTGGLLCQQGMRAQGDVSLLGSVSDLSGLRSLRANEEREAGLDPHGGLPLGESLLEESLSGESLLGEQAWMEEEDIKEVNLSLSSSRISGTPSYEVGSGVSLAGGIPPSSCLVSIFPVVIWVVHREVYGITNEVSTIVGTQVAFGNQLGEVSIRTVKGRFMPAVVGVLLGLVGEMRSLPVAFAMEEAWLAKHLVQKARTLRALGLAGRVLALHRLAAQRKVALAVVGPVAAPEGLVDAVEEQAVLIS